MQKLNGHNHPNAIVTKDDIVRDATEYQIYPRSFVMDEGTQKTLRRLAERENMTESAILRALIRKHEISL